MEISSISNLWNKWNIRSFVILSLLLQVFLILFASLRKKTANRPIIFLLWLAYLMADWVAAFTIGLISHNQDISWPRAAEVDRALQAFWSSFLLLHLGGPDTITAFSLEDSSLWRRHLLSLIFQVSAAIYVFGQIFPSDKSLAISMMLVFFTGVIKNVERLSALYLSSLPTLREKMILQYNSTVDKDNELIEELNVQGDEYSNEEKAKLAESIVVKHAYYYHQIFKFFLGELIVPDGERKMTRECFQKVSAMDALRIISVQLQFIYEVLYTKALAIHSKRSYIFRFIAFTNVVLALVLFNHLNKHQFTKLDVEITHMLLFGGIALDVIGVFKLIFSDWTVAKIKWHKTGSPKLPSFPLKLVFAMSELRKLRFSKREAKSSANVSYTILDTPFILRRWSESISACNLLSESLKESPRTMYKGNQCWGVIVFSDICSFPFHMAKKIISLFHQAGKTITKGCDQKNMEVMIADTKYVSNNPFIKELWIFIFKEVRRKSENTDDLMEMKKIFEARGDMFLHNCARGINCGNLLEYVTPATYDFSILTWHFATEIWYNREKQFMSYIARNDEREFSKILSNYMLYLLLNQANLVSAIVGISQITSAATLAELRRYIDDTTKDVEGLCKMLYDNRFGPLDPSPLSAGIKLAQEMESLGEMKWKVMSGVWVEMLLYAAGHTKVEEHLKVPNKGGELLTFVWLLMVHFGFYNYKCDMPTDMPSP